MQQRTNCYTRVRKPINEYTVILTILLGLIGLIGVNLLAYASAQNENASLAKAAAQAAAAHSNRAKALVAAIKVFQNTSRSPFLKNEVGIKNETLDFRFDDLSAPGVVKVNSRLAFCPPIAIPFLSNNGEAEVLCATAKEAINPNEKSNGSDQDNIEITSSEEVPVSTRQNLPSSDNNETDSEITQQSHQSELASLPRTLSHPSTNSQFQAPYAVRTCTAIKPVMQQQMLQQDMLQQSFVQQEAVSQVSKPHYASFRASSNDNQI